MTLLYKIFSRFRLANYMNEEVTPWVSHSSYTLLEHSVNQVQNRETQRNRAHDHNSHTIRASKSKDKFFNVLPRVYQKKSSQSSQLLQHKLVKKQQGQLRLLSIKEVMLLMPQRNLALPKMRPEHLIKHDSRQSKDPKASQEKHRRDHFIDKQWSEMVKIIKKNSNKCLRHMRSQSNLAQRQMIKKCTLNNLQIFRAEPGGQQLHKHSAKAELNHQHHNQHHKSQRKHFLDVVLTKLE